MDSKPKAKTSEKHFEVKELHGKVKHEILKMYLDAFVPIMAQSNDKVIIIDGFCGKGIFESGPESNKNETTRKSESKIDFAKDGSPIIAIKAVLDHKLKDKFKTKIEFIFIDNEKNNIEVLENQIELLKNDYPNYKDFVEIKTINNEFDVTLGKILENPDYFNAPMFLFADPFGYSGVPMELLKKFLARNKCDILINFAENSVNRWFSDENKWETITKLFGSEDWKSALEEGLITTEKMEIFLNLYKTNLSNLGCKTADLLYFGIKDKRNRHLYHLVFGTKNMAGIKIMKIAMARSSQDVETLFFSDFKSLREIPQIDVKSSEYKEMCAEKSLKAILQKYNGKTENGETLKNFIFRETAYYLNFKNELRSLMKNYIDGNGKGKFDKLIFSIPNTNAATNEASTQNVTQSDKTINSSNVDQDVSQVPSTSKQYLTQSLIQTPIKAQKNILNFFPSIATGNNTLLDQHQANITNALSVGNPPISPNKRKASPQTTPNKKTQTINSPRRYSKKAKLIDDKTQQKITQTFAISPKKNSEI